MWKCVRERERYFAITCETMCVNVSVCTGERESVCSRVCFVTRYNVEKERMLKCVWEREIVCNYVRDNEGLCCD